MPGLRKCAAQARPYGAGRDALPTRGAFMAPDKNELQAINTSWQIAIQERNFPQCFPLKANE
jgi:hypothetical protein